MSLSKLNVLTDNELLSMLREGNASAYTEIYERFNGLLYLFAYKRLHDREEAKDIIHELFLSLWTNRENLPQNANLSAYLYTAVRNRIINIATHQKTVDRYIESFQSYINTNNNNTDHLVRHNELLKFIEKQIAELPPKTRLVFEMSRKTNLTRKEIAAELQITEETVKSHMHGALKALRLKLGALIVFVF
jgi:RNA polymerase sigma-70 factor (ECF subfamily)